MSKPTDDLAATSELDKGIRAPECWRDIHSPEMTLSAPVIHPVTIGWGDCDPAQIAYTANIPAWGLLAIEAWYQQCVGANWYELNLQHGIGTPFVSLGFDFKAPVKPGPLLKITVTVARMGHSSVSHEVVARQRQVVKFTGKTTAAFVDARSMKPMAIPDNIRHRIAQYIDMTQQTENETVG